MGMKRSVWAMVGAGIKNANMVGLASEWNGCMCVTFIMSKTEQVGQPDSWQVLSLTVWCYHILLYYGWEDYHVKWGHDSVFSNGNGLPN